MKKSITSAFLTLTIAYMSAAQGARQKVNAHSPDAMPTLDQLLENYVEAIGGKAAIGRITSRPWSTSCFRSALADFALPSRREMRIRN